METLYAVKAKPAKRRGDSDAHAGRVGGARRAAPTPAGTPRFLQRAAIHDVAPDALQRQPEGPALEPIEEPDQEFLLQTKLTVGQVGDVYEQEADTVARTVVRSPAPQVQRWSAFLQPRRTPPIQRLCAECEREEEEEQESPEAGTAVQRSPLASPPPSGAAANAPLVQRRCAACEQNFEEQPVQTKATGPGRPTQSVVESAVQTAHGGSPMPASVRQRVEPVLGVDLSEVRVHRDVAANTATQTLRAKAFTHQHHIWLGSGQSPHDVELMAHEATHVVQQTSGAAPVQTLQQAPADYRHPEDGAAPAARLQQAIGGEVEELPEAGEQDAAAQAEAASKVEQIDEGELAARETELEPKAQPDVDRPAEEAPGIESAAEETRVEVEADTEPITEGEAEGEAEEPAAEGEQAGAESEADAAASLARTAFAMASSLPQPPALSRVTPPPPVQPMDAGGEPLPGDPLMDLEIQQLADHTQFLRDEGLRIRQRAIEERGNAQILRGNISLIRGGTAQAAAGLETAAEHLEYRKEVVTQAREALAISEEKAEKGARDAPGYRAKAEQGAEDSGPMAAEAGEMASRSAANRPKNARAARKSAEQGQKINRVGSDARTVDDAVQQTRSRAERLDADAERAKGLNEETKGTLDEAGEVIGQSGEKLAALDQHTQQARSAVDTLAGQPAAMTAQAEQLDLQGLSLVQMSFDLEQRLARTQRVYDLAMRRVPPLEEMDQAAPEEEPEQEVPREETGEEMAVQRAPQRGYEGRESIELISALPGWLTGRSERQQEALEQREQTQADADAGREQAIDEIRELAGGRAFEELGAADKLGIALRLTGRNLFGSLSEISWPSPGDLALGLIDPRGPLTGVVTGLGMMLSGAANLFSAQQWKQDPLGNLLKSAADIASGLAVILGSITVLAGVIAAILTAITILSFGAAAPITGPIIAFCTSVMVTVGGWTIAVGKVALVLQALTLIKNLIDAATAETAEELKRESDQITANVSDAGNVLMQMGVAKLSQIGGRATQARIAATPGGAAAFARGIPGRLAAGARGAARAAGRGGIALGRGVAGAARAAGRGVIAGPRAVGRAISGRAQAAWKRAADLRTRLRTRFAKEEGVLAKHRTPDGHEVKVTAAGIVRCSGCAQLRHVYSDLVDNVPFLRKQLDQLDDLARKAGEMKLSPDPKVRGQATRLAKRVDTDVRGLGARLRVLDDFVRQNGPDAAKLLAKHGDNAATVALRFPKDAMSLLRTLDEIANIPGADGILKDLAAGQATAQGTLAEMRYILELRRQGARIERVADVIGGKKAADILLKRGPVVDVKHYNWNSSFYRQAFGREIALRQLTKQATLHRTRYPGRPIRFAFLGSKADIPGRIVKALESMGVEVVGIP